MFKRLYATLIQWSKHQHAKAYLAGVSFAESSFFPLPPDIMLVCMGLTGHYSIWRLAGITTLFSVLGGLFGYLLGFIALALTLPSLEYLGYLNAYHTVKAWFAEWGIWVVFVAGFSPIPYKLFTIAAGAVKLNIFAFAGISLIARGARFYLVATLIHFGGQHIDRLIRRYVDTIGWLVSIIVLGIAIVYWLI